MTIYELIQRAADLRGRYEVDSITPEEVGGLAEDTLAYVADIEKNMQALGIKRIYPTYDAMETDTEPVGDNMMPIRFGQLVVVAENASIYRYNGNGQWGYVSKFAGSYEPVGITWDTSSNMDELNRPGLYYIDGERSRSADNLPIDNMGPIAAWLRVSRIGTDNSLVAQVLELSNKGGNETKVYTRTYNGHEWSAWSTLQGMREVGAVANASDFDTYTNSGMYSGMLMNSSQSRGRTFLQGSTFLLITVSGYAVEKYGITPQATQLLYMLPPSYDFTTGNTRLAAADVYTSTGLWTGTQYSWGNWKRLTTDDELLVETQAREAADNRLSERATMHEDTLTTQGKQIAQLQSGLTDEVAQREAADSAMAKKQLNLSVLDNGNIVLSNTNGESKEFMPATPSGDPMHYMYEADGASYNATDEDIPMVGVYGDSYVHKAKHWHLNELGDLTNDDMRTIYQYRYNTLNPNLLAAFWQTNQKCRTNLSLSRANLTAHSESFAFFQSYCETISHLNATKGHGSLLTNASSFARNSIKLRKVLTPISLQYVNSASNVDRPFEGCPALEEARIEYLKYSIAFESSSKLSNASILYMIQKEEATAAITITLHADAYERAMADASIQEALINHPNVSLAKA